MKKLLALLLSLTMAFSLASCSAQDVDSDSTADTEIESTVTATPVNESELKPGVYTGKASYATEGFSMEWNIVIDFNEDGTFVLSNDAGEEKGTGTYALTDTCYTMSYNDERSSTFAVLADGGMEFTSELPFGKASIGLEEVGGITLTYYGERYEFVSADDSSQIKGVADAGVTTGTYSASYTKESRMAGTVTYNYTAQLGEDASFSYSVTFDMKGTMYDGSSATGTYSVQDGKFVFTDSEGNVTEGAVTADNTFVISLFASQMASEPYEVTFVVAE